MNYELLKYRLVIGGVPWALRTALGLAAEKTGHTVRRSPLPNRVGSARSGAPQIAYLHSGWAIETVGRLWFESQNMVNVEFRHTGTLGSDPEFHEESDYVWYGYSSLYSRYPCPPQKAIMAIHDPVELFPEDPHWKDDPVIGPKKKELLLGVHAIIVISREMQEILQTNGIPSIRIATKSTLPPRDPDELRDSDHFQFLSVGRIYRRKNFEQFRRIASTAAATGIPSYLKCDHFASSLKSYLELLDRYPVYVCTSFQEGGPLPLMDAMLRGAIPISTAVGQVPEIITSGVNGFVCQTDAQFLETLSFLQSHPDRINALRRKAIEAIRTARSDRVIRSEVENCLSLLFGPH